MKKVLIIEDDLLVAELERDYLEASDYEVEICSDGTEGMNLAVNGDYDIILIDVMLPGENGFNICRKVREIKNIPVIMVTARNTDIDKIRGFGLGIDDYITKPFSPAELVARVNAHIKIHEKLLEASCHTEKNNDSICVGDLRIIAGSRRVLVDGKEVVLKNKEFELLLFLAENPDIVFSKDTLFDRIWGFDAVGDTATVTVHINRIRDKIEKNPSEPQFIQTVWGAGYRFCTSIKK